MILITGASSGIGEATAERFARDGGSLILWARRTDRLAAVKKHCLELGAKEVHTATVDVRKNESITSEVTKFHELYSRVEILVNNAGLAKGLATFQDSALQDFKDMIDTNVTGFIQVTHAILPLLLKKNRGHLIHLGSVAGRWTYPKGHVYCASKAAIRALSEGIRMDLNGTALRVTEIAPGMVDTEFSTVRLGDAERAKGVYEGLTALSGQDIADAIHWVSSRPAHVNIQEMVIYPVAQASPTIVSRQ